MYFSSQPSRTSSVDLFNESDEGPLLASQVSVHQPDTGDTQINDNQEEFLCFMEGRDEHLHDETLTLPTHEHLQLHHIPYTHHTKKIG